mmetsp:Transcript_16992/g.24869  ORF Transcript_16992/g.24869 Transcript_16992/m.24869 type:complete len:157 (-) Transcript_16992:30-500(-)
MALIKSQQLFRNCLGIQRQLAAQQFIKIFSCNFRSLCPLFAPNHSDNASILTDSYLSLPAVIWRDPEYDPEGPKVTGILTGKVMSAKMQKSIVVGVQRMRTHPKYRVRQFRTKKIMAHDPEDCCELGDTVRIKPCRPLSKKKRYTLVEVSKREKKL